MSSSIERVSQNSNNTREITNKAIGQAQQASERVSFFLTVKEKAEVLNNVMLQLQAMTEKFKV